MGQAAHVLVAVATLLLLSASCSVYVRGAELEGFEDDTPAPEPASPGLAQTARQEAVEPAASKATDNAAQEPTSQQPGGLFEEQQAAGAAEGTAPAAATRKRLPQKKRDNYYFEISIVSFFLVYVTTAILGNRKNDKLAHAWTQAFIARGSILEKNFQVTGAEDGEVTRDAPNVFKFYARGRRHCEGMLATLNLKARQDLTAMLWHLISPTEDTMDVEVYMHEASMPSVVLAVGTPKAARNLQSTYSDIKKYTKRINIANDLARGWPNARLHVLAEHSSIFYDLFSDPRMLQIFTSPQHAEALKYFRSIVVTSENTEGSQKRLLRFQFALPSAAQMADITALVAMVPLLIDLVGTYRLPPEIKKKTAEARAKHEAAALEEERKARMDKIQQRKLDKLQEEKERVAKLGPEARRKYEEKLARQQAKKQYRTKIVRM